MPKLKKIKRDFFKYLVIFQTMCCNYSAKKKSKKKQFPRLFSGWSFFRDSCPCCCGPNKWLSIRCTVETLHRSTKDSRFSRSPHLEPRSRLASPWLAGTYTVFKNQRKSLIQHCERGKLRLHFE